MVDIAESPVPDHAVLPDLRRRDVGTILVSPWLVGDLERQRAAVDATLAGYDHFGLPDGFLSLSCFVSVEGTTVVYYAQWTSDEAHREFQRTDRPALARGVDELVPGIERPGVTRYRLYRDYLPAGDTPGPAACVVLVTVTFETPGRAHGWVDSVIEAMRAADPVPGLISNYFHVSVSDTRVLNYAEWTDAAAHRAAVESGLGPIDRHSADSWHGADGPRFREMPGVVDIAVERCQLYRSLRSHRRVA